MDRDLRTAAVWEVYAAYAAGEPEPLWALLAPHVTFHVGGDHPLSGDYLGLDEVLGYLETVERAHDQPRATTVDSVFADETGDLVLVNSTSRHGTFERAVGHVLRFEGDRLVELWDNPADPESEDRFWRLHLPAQRTPGASSGRRRGGALPAPRLGSSH